MIACAAVRRRASCRMNSSPSMPGICKSVITTSNARASSSGSASTALASAFDGVARLAQHVDHARARRSVVVDDQHAAWRAARVRLRLVWHHARHYAATPMARRGGSSIVNAAPPSGQFIAVTRPPCASAIAERSTAPARCRCSWS